MSYNNDLVMKGSLVVNDNLSPEKKKKNVKTQVWWGKTVRSVPTEDPMN